MPPQEDYRERVRRTAQELGVDPAWALAIAEQESGFRPEAVSPQGATGVMQLMPPTAASLAQRYGGNPQDPHDNVRLGIQLLRDLQQKYQNRDLEAAAYFSGEPDVDRYQGIPPFPKVQAYVPEVQQRYARWQQQPGGRPSPAPTRAPGPWATGDPVKTTNRILDIYAGRDPVYRPDPEIAAHLKMLQEEIEEIPSQYADVRASQLYMRLNEALTSQEQPPFSPEAMAALAKVRDQLWAEMGGSQLSQGQINLPGALGGLTRGFTQQINPSTTSAASRVDWPTELGPRSGVRGTMQAIWGILGAYAPIGAAVAATGGLGAVPIAIGAGLGGFLQERNRQAVQDRELEAIRQAIATHPEGLTAQTTPFTAEQLQPRTNRQAAAAQIGQAGVNAVTWPAGLVGIPKLLGPVVQKVLGPAVTAAVAKVGKPALAGIPRWQLMKAQLPVEAGQLGVNLADAAATLGVIQGSDPVARGVNPLKVAAQYPEIVGLPPALAVLGLLLPKGSLARTVALTTPGPRPWQAEVAAPPERPTAPETVDPNAPRVARKARPYQRTPIRAVEAYQDLVSAQGHPIEGEIGKNFQAILTRLQKEQSLEQMAGKPIARLEGPDLPSETYYHGELQAFDQGDLPLTQGRHMVTIPDPADPGFRVIKWLNDEELLAYRRWMATPKGAELAAEPGDFIPAKLWRSEGVAQPVTIPGVEAPVTGRAYGTTNDLGEVVVYYRDPRVRRVVRGLFPPEVAHELDRWLELQESLRTRPIADSVEPIVPRTFADIPTIGGARPAAGAPPPPPPPPVPAGQAPPVERQLSLPGLMDEILRETTRPRRRRTP